MSVNKRRFLKKPIFVILTLSAAKGKDLYSRRDSSPGACAERSECELRMTTFYDFFRDFKRFLILCLLFVGIFTPFFGQPGFCAQGLGQSEFVYDAKGKRNPFIPLVTPEGRLLKLDKQEPVSSGGLAIEGIIYDKLGRSFAIVNAAVVGIGDTVGDYQVLKIYENKVIFIKNGEPFEVELTNDTPRE